MNNKNKIKKNPQGYIALISLLLVVSAGLTIGLAVSLGGIDELQMSLGNSQSVRAKSLANSCIEDGLERLRNNWANYTGTLSIDSDSCIINIVISSNATLTAVGTADIYTQEIITVVDSNLNIISWSE